MIDKAGELNATITANKKELDSLKKEIKSKNLSKISGSKYVAEVSERVSTSFDEEKLLTKVKDIGANWLLKEVVDEDRLEESLVKGEYVPETDEHIENIINARDFFREYCEVNKDYGDPGALFKDRMQKYNLLSGYNDYVVNISNPCVTGDTVILTRDGYKRIDTLVNKQIDIWNGYMWSDVTPIVTGHNQKMLTIGVSNGRELNCTKYHKFILADGSRVKAKDLKLGDKLAKWSFPVIESGEYDSLHDPYTNGFYSGNGIKGRDEIAIYGDKERIIPYLKVDHVNKQKTRLMVVLSEHMLGKVYVPSAETNIDYRLKWLAGLIDSDGSKNDIGGSVSITSVDKEFLLNVQLLLNTLGCSSTVSKTRDEAYRELPVNDVTDNNKLYLCKSCYRITISAWEMRKLLELGLSLHRVVINPMPDRDASRFITVTSISTRDDEETVYCFTEYINHSGIFNGIMTAQCGEYIGNDYNSCLLSSINLYNIVEDKFTKKASIDYNKLEHLIRLGINVLDETLDYGLDLLPLEPQKKCAKEWRAIGLGVFGLADMFVALGVKYGSKESLKYVSDIFDFMNVIALDESANLAQKYGAFEKYNWESTKKSPIIKALLYGHSDLYYTGKAESPLF